MLVVMSSPPPPAVAVVVDVRRNVERIDPVTHKYCSQCSKVQANLLHFFLLGIRGALLLFICVPSWLFCRSQPARFNAGVDGVVVVVIFCCSESADLLLDCKFEKRIDCSFSETWIFRTVRIKVTWQSEHNKVMAVVDRYREASSQVRLVRLLWERRER